LNGVLEKLKFPVIQEIFRLYGTQKFIIALQKPTNECCIEPVKSIPHPHIHFNIMLSSNA